VIKQAQKKQTGDKDITIHYSYRIITKSGNVKWIEQYSKTITFEGKNADLITLIDITERKRAEEDKERLFKAVEIAKEAVSIQSADLITVYANDAMEKLFGYKKRELIGKHVSILDTDVTSESTVRQIVEDIEKHGYWEGEVHNKRKDGSEFITYASTTAIKGKDGKIIDFISTQHDIIERRRAEEELRDSREQLRNLAGHLQSVREEERTTIAREIHDELAQALTALKMDISWLGKRIPKDQKILREKTRAMTELTDTTIKTVKKISTELRPGLLDDLGLVAAIEWQAEEFQNRTGITCRIDVDPEDIMVGEKRSTTLFRIFQETLTNIARHAHATTVTVSLKEKDSSLELRVRDNGKGITKEQISDPQSFGLIGIRERVHPWKGEVKISGRPGKGTTVVVRIPVAN